MQKCGAYRRCVHGPSWTPLFGGSGRVTCMVTLADAECQDLLTLSARMQECGAYRRCVHGSSWMDAAVRWVRPGHLHGDTY